MKKLIKIIIYVIIIILSLKLIIAVGNYIKISNTSGAPAKIVAGADMHHVNALLIRLVLIHMCVSDKKTLWGGEDRGRQSVGFSRQPGRIRRSNRNDNLHQQSMDSY